MRALSLFRLVVGVFLVALWALPAAAQTAPDIQALLARSDKTWDERHLNGNDQQSLIAAEQALKAGADEFEATWRIARAAFWIAERTPDNGKKERYGKQGFEAGKRAAELKPARVEGWFWGVCALGQYGTGIGVVRALFKGVSGDFEKMAEKAIKLDASYTLGGPPRAYGLYWYSLPKVKQDLAKAERYMKQSISLAPGKARSHLYLAQIYLAQDKRDAAKAELDLCLATDPKKEEYPDGILFLVECKKLLEKTVPTAAK